MVVTTYFNDIRTRDNLLVKCMILDSTCIFDLLSYCLVVISPLHPPVSYAGRAWFESRKSASDGGCVGGNTYVTFMDIATKSLRTSMTARSSVSKSTNALGAQSIEIDWPSARNGAVTESNADHAQDNSALLD